MAKDKKSVLLYCDIIHTIEKMDNATAGEFFKHYLRYINDLNPTTDNIVVDIAFESVKQNLKRDLKKYENICERNALNGSKGGRPKKPKKPSGLIGNPKEPKKADTDNDTDTDIDINKKNNKKDIVFRVKEFEKSLIPFVNIYKKEMLREFANYWCEYSPGDKKIRKEKEKTFGLKRRLTTWHNSEYNNHKNESSKSIKERTAHIKNNVGKNSI
jgi:hypothetical protein